MGTEDARAIFPICYSDEEKCPRGIADLQIYRKKWAEMLGQFRSEPLQDEHSLGADAFRAGAVVVREGFTV